MSIFSNQEQTQKKLKVPELFQAYTKQELKASDTKSRAQFLVREGYSVTADDLNKLRQLFKKVHVMHSDEPQKIVLALKRLTAILLEAHTESGKDTFNKQEVAQIHTAVSSTIHYNISVTSINKYSQLLAQGKIEL